MRTLAPTAQTVLLCGLLGLALAIGVVLAQDPTSHIKAYPAITTHNCGGSNYAVTAQAWQISACVFTVRYDVKGKPGLSDFGFQYAHPTPRLISHSLSHT
jgi:hypothetical protein